MSMPLSCLSRNSACRATLLFLFFMRLCRRGSRSAPLEGELRREPTVSLVSSHEYDDVPPSSLDAATKAGRLNFPSQSLQNDCPISMVFFWGGGRRSACRPVELRMD